MKQRFSPLVVLAALALSSASALDFSRGSQVVVTDGHRIVGKGQVEEKVLSLELSADFSGLAQLLVYDLAGNVQAFEVKIASGGRVTLLSGSAFLSLSELVTAELEVAVSLVAPAEAIPEGGAGETPIPPGSGRPREEKAAREEAEDGHQDGKGQDRKAGRDGPDVAAEAEVEVKVEVKVGTGAKANSSAGPSEGEAGDAYADGYEGGDVHEDERGRGDEAGEDGPPAHAKRTPRRP